MFLAQAYYQVGNQALALETITKAIKMEEDAGRKPREQWLSFELGLYFEKNEDNNIIRVLEKLVKLYPKQTYWRQLSGMYGVVGREKDQMHALETLYLMGGMKKDKEIRAAALKAANVFTEYKSPNTRSSRFVFKKDIL